MTLELQSRAAGVSFVPPEVLAMLPYLATVVVLTLIALRGAGGQQAPACLGKAVPRRRMIRPTASGRPRG